MTFLVAGQRGYAVDPAYDGVDLVQIAMGICRMSHKDAAGFYGVSPGEWSRVMSRQRPLDLARLWGFPALWWREFSALLAARYGLTVRDAHQPSMDDAAHRLMAALVEMQQQLAAKAPANKA